jgi:hypothetical protein
MPGVSDKVLGREDCASWNDQVTALNKAAAELAAHPETNCYMDEHPADRAESYP